MDKRINDTYSHKQIFFVRIELELLIRVASAIHKRKHTEAVIVSYEILQSTFLKIHISLLQKLCTYVIDDARIKFVANKVKLHTGYEVNNKACFYKTKL